MKAYIPCNSPYDPLDPEVAQRRMNEALGALLDRDLVRNNKDEGFGEPELEE